MCHTVLETPRLSLIAAAPEHADFISKMWNTPEVKPWLLDYDLKTPEDALKKLILPLGENYFLKNGKRFCMCVIQEKKTGKLIGINGMLKRPFLDSPNIGYALIIEACGKGYACESCRGLIEYCKELGYRKLYAGNVNPENDKSINLLTKLGMELEDPAFEWGQGGSVGQLYAMGV